MNNADFGMTFKSLICQKYNISPNNTAKEQFQSNYNHSYEKIINPHIKKIFNQIGSEPIVCNSFEKDPNNKGRFLPYDFTLKNGCTLSIKTNKNSDKVAPRVVGQAGLNTLNIIFSDIFDYVIEDKNDIKAQIYSHIHQMLPIFIDYMFNADYTVFIAPIYNQSNYWYQIIDNKYFVDISFERENFSFSKKLSDWNESITLKYKNLSIAEIQIHKNRTFKFRFIMTNFFKLLKLTKKTNETIGITAEKTICDLYNLEYPNHLTKRSSEATEWEMRPVIEKAFKESQLPLPIEHTGSTKGERGKKSKCSYDFILNGGFTLSVKTNQNMICPPEVGQPSAETCYQYFCNFIEGGKVTNDTFKQMVFDHIEDIMPIYINHLFDSDYMLWLHKGKRQWKYEIFTKNTLSNFVWEHSKFSYTKSNIKEWIESNTVKYNGVSIGEFQIHNHRNCYKFRVNMKNIKKLIKE